MPTNPCIQSLWRAHQWAVRALANAKLAPPAALTVVLPCSLSLCASFLDAGRTSHRKQFVYYSRAAVSVPFRRLPTHSPGWRFPTLRIGRPNLDLRSRLGLPVPNPKSLSVLLPTQAFCIPLTRQHLPTHNRCKFTAHRTEPPTHAARKLHAIAHSVLVKFSFSRTQPPRTQSGGSRFFSRSSLLVGTP